MTITCEQCAYWEQREGEVGWCRRDPPGKLAYGWPLSRRDDWCGQAMPRKCGSTQPVHEAAQAILDAVEFDDALGFYPVKYTLLEDLREALQRMKP
jgi:hypothetical protein